VTSAFTTVRFTSLMVRWVQSYGGWAEPKPEWTRYIIKMAHVFDSNLRVYVTIATDLKYWWIRWNMIRWNMSKGARKS